MNNTPLTPEERKALIANAVKVLEDVTEEEVSGFPDSLLRVLSEDFQLPEGTDPYRDSDEMEDENRLFSRSRHQPNRDAGSDKD